MKKNFPKQGKGVNLAGFSGYRGQRIVPRAIPPAFFIQITNSATADRNYDLFNAWGAITPSETVVAQATGDSDITISEGSSMGALRNRTAVQNIAIRGFKYDVENVLNFNQPFSFYFKDYDSTQQSKNLATLITLATDSQRQIATTLDHVPANFILAGDTTLVVGCRGSETVTISFKVVNALRAV